MKAEQFWVIDINGEVIYRAKKKLEARVFASVFQQGCRVIAVARVAS